MQNFAVEHLPLQAGCTSSSTYLPSLISGQLLQICYRIFPSSYNLAASYLTFSDPSISRLLTNSSTPPAVHSSGSALLFFPYSINNQVLQSVNRAVDIRSSGNAIERIVRHSDTTLCSSLLHLFVMSDNANTGSSVFEFGFITPPSSPIRRFSLSPAFKAPFCPKKACRGGWSWDGYLGPVVITPPDSPIKRGYRKPAAFRPLTDSCLDGPDETSAFGNKTPEFPIDAPAAPFFDGTLEDHVLFPPRSPDTSPCDDDNEFIFGGKPKVLLLTADPTNSEDDGSSTVKLNGGKRDDDIFGPTLDEPNNRDWVSLSQFEGLNARVTHPDSNDSNLSIEHSSKELRPFPLRQSSSPLRPNQSLMRARTSTPSKSITKNHDRFIPQRRPPNQTRESFELNKPRYRVAVGEGLAHGRPYIPDPFSRRLQRSGRLNEELQSLRETHSLLSGRASLNRRPANLGLRGGPFPRNPLRQVSTGGVWNVGGASPTSDTVVGVSNGRGGMLGSETNAPLYTSMFLSRSDPEAELETYERRLALALDVNQSNRVLESTVSPYSSRQSTPTHSDSARSPFRTGQSRHVWRDSAWVKEGCNSR